MDIIFPVNVWKVPLLPKNKHTHTHRTGVTYNCRFQFISFVFFSLTPSLFLAVFFIQMNFGSTAFIMAVACAALFKLSVKSASPARSHYMHQFLIYFVLSHYAIQVRILLQQKCGKKYITKQQKQRWNAKNNNSSSGTQKRKKLSASEL